MQDTTLEDRKHELSDLLSRIEAHPERDWVEARKRIAVLRTMIAEREAAHSDA